MTKVELGGQVGEATAGVGDGDKLVTCPLLTDGGGGQPVAILGERESFDGATGLGRGDEQGACGIEAASGIVDGDGIGAVEHGEVEKPGQNTKKTSEDFRCHRRSPHTEQQGMGEAIGTHGIDQGVDL